MQSLVYKKKVLAEAKIQEDNKRESLRKADEQHQKDKAILIAARQQRKISSSQNVMDRILKSQNKGSLFLE